MSRKAPPRQDSLSLNELPSGMDCFSEEGIGMQYLQGHSMGHTELLLPDGLSSRDSLSPAGPGT